VILRLALAEVRSRPGRAAFLLGGYALGVAVMVVLLAVGEAMLEQARDRALVGGGDVVVVPGGVSPEMLKSGGVSSLYLGIDHARFIQRNVLESPRAREDYGIVAAGPILDARQVEVEAGGRRFTGIATGEIPSRARAAGAAPRLLSGAWTDTEADGRWAAPTAAELLREMDGFHRPPVRDSTWAEWHYFNVVLDSARWIYATLMVAGEVGVPGRWGGRVLLTVRDADGTHRSMTNDVPGERVRFDTASPDVRLGGAGSVRLEADVYHVVAAAGGTRVELRIRPTQRLYFPRTDLGGTEIVSGYVVPALHAVAEGTVCIPACEEVRGATAYHDHNWGVWRGVSWDWGAASDGESALLYGAVRGEETADEGLFAYLVDRRGARGVYRPGPIRVLETRPQRFEGRTLDVPARFTFADPRRRLEVEVRVTAAHVTAVEREDRRYFVQMRGEATVTVDGRPAGTLPGFFETYLG
jgi:hypothetical protein